ncbi:MAG: hypothetical protein RIF41_22070 [Polyangiaceae bacterium]
MQKAGMVLVAIMAMACDKEPPGSEPSTATAAATATATPTTKAGPSKKEAKVASLETMQAFVKAASAKNIKLEQPEVITEEKGNDPNKLIGRPNQYLAKTNWKIDGNDATLEVFATAEDATNRAEYVRGLGKKAPMFLQYVYVHPQRHAVLRVLKELAPTEAEKWEALLLSI